MHNFVGSVEFITEDLIPALESGDYTQTVRKLQGVDGSMCCLGVACDITDWIRWDSANSARNENNVNDYPGTSMPPAGWQYDFNGTPVDREALKAHEWDSEVAVDDFGELEICHILAAINDTSEDFGPTIKALKIMTGTYEG